ncbi:MAG: type II toxin-antitoxin system RelE/ParE family toxin [Nitrosomonadaceae bacterium]|nr:type II toxin-antitoxin system RelE/ParE family toxin [Nitrosomonadaceae bacterium]
MKLEIADKELEEAYRSSTYSGRYSAAILSAYRKRLGFISQAVDERDFRGMRSLNFEKLKGSRSHQYSMRLNKQFRLILELKGDGPGKTVKIMGIEDYH